VDKIMRGLQSNSLQVAFIRFRAVSLRMDLVALELRASAVTMLQEGDVVVAKVIEFYIPKNFRKPVKWTPPLECGKVIEFCVPVKKSA